jgi:hypothetical protein
MMVDEIYVLVGTYVIMDILVLARGALKTAMPS